MKQEDIIFRTFTRTIKIGHRHFVPRFSVGVQGFNIGDLMPKREAVWMCKMLTKAIMKMINRMHLYDGLTKQQHKRALAVIQKLMDKDPNKNTLEGQTLRLLAEIVERYEKVNFLIGG